MNTKIHTISKEEFASSIGSSLVGRTATGDGRGSIDSPDSTGREDLPGATEVHCPSDTVGVDRPDDIGEETDVNGEHPLIGEELLEEDLPGVHMDAANCRGEDF